jgi:large subunit ribosomal protein L21
MKDFAIIKTGGKQYRVAQGDLLEVEKLGDTLAIGDSVSFDEVLLTAKGETVEVGTPVVKGAKVSAVVTEIGRDRKKIIFKYHSKARFQKTRGHRQHYTQVKITAI